jgi:putative radical SAM enzyme (TIGR03279 family)
MPRGLRPSLYIKDDDYRYSFLFGNFITLTNLTEADWRRLEEQRLSPLYVSVHATEPELRRQLLGCRRVPDILEQIRRLGTLHIRIHAQVVVTPGLNDGAHLARTVADLSDLHPTVQSIGIVPVGLTRHWPGTRLPLRTMSSSEARAIAAETRKWQGQFWRRFGTRLVWASDEIYLLAGARIPGARAYEGFPQLENGVGLVRSLLMDWQRIKQRGLPPGRVTPSPQGPALVTVVTGTLAAPVLAPALAELQSLLDERGEAARFRLLPVANRFFGETVTVAGLLTATDVLEALKGQHLGQAVFLPRAMFDSAGEVTLDDATLRDFREALGVAVHYASQLSQIVQVLCQAPS